ncbi:hypothetical protein JCM11491_006885 [Sporobolomyces phaffii]
MSRNSTLVTTTTLVEFETSIKRIEKAWDTEEAHFNLGLALSPKEREQLAAWCGSARRFVSGLDRDGFGAKLHGTNGLGHTGYVFLKEPYNFIVGWFSSPVWLTEHEQTLTPVVTVIMRIWSLMLRSTTIPIAPRPHRARRRSRPLTAIPVFEKKATLAEQLGLYDLLVKIDASIKQRWDEVVGGSYELPRLEEKLAVVREEISRLEKTCSEAPRSAGATTLTGILEENKAFSRDPHGAAKSDPYLPKLGQLLNHKAPTSEPAPRGLGLPFDLSTGVRPPGTLSFAHVTPRKQRIYGFSL